MIIPAHNEERHLPAKLANLAALEYPKDRLEILFVSDGSTDATNEILGRAAAGATSRSWPCPRAVASRAP